MIYGSVCSGIEAASVAWHILGWQASFLSEIEKFPRAVLEHHYPDVPLHGDFTTIQKDDYEPIDLLVGGTPCQDFSVAGLRAGITGERGSLTLEFVRLADRLKPRWIVWENVPGVLSSDGGKALGAFLGALEELGYGWAYRTLDAQYFGVPQRRRRVFVVGYLGDWRRAAAVLFERESLRGDSPPSHGKKNEVARCLAARAGAGGGFDLETETAIVFRADQTIKHSADTMPTLTRNMGKQVPGVAQQSVAPSLTASNDPSRSPQSSEVTQQVLAVHQAVMQVRRLTPIECERLQGFPDNYTNIPWRKQPTSPDGPRYKALGNSMAVPVMRWVGERIQMIDDLSNCRDLFGDKI